MAEIKQFGASDLDKEATEIQIVRDICHEISLFGLNEKQKYNLIHFLALELENHEHMVELVSLIKGFNKKTLFVDYEERKE